MMPLAPLTERRAGVIEVFDNAIPNPDEVLAEIVKQANWLEAEIGGAKGLHRDETIRDSDVHWIPALDFRNPPLLHDFIKTIWLHLDDYGVRYDRSFSGIESMNINRYMPGQQYHVHADAGAKSPRVLSALVYLNDDFDGGETEFVYHDVAISPKAGRLVIFPSDFAYSHAALPPSDGVKYSAALWAYA